MKRWIHANTNKFNRAISLIRSRVKGETMQPFKDVLRKGNTIEVILNNGKKIAVTESEIDDCSYIEKILKIAEG